MAVPKRYVNEKKDYANTIYPHNVELLVQWIIVKHIFLYNDNHYKYSYVYLPTLINDLLFLEVI